MTDDQIKHMVSRFLGWKLPADFNPDAGISFVDEFNIGTLHPMRHEPSGTNLFDATQAEAMVRYMVEGMPSDLGRVAVLESALLHLTNEVLGSLPLIETTARQEMGNTNYRLLIHRAEEGRLALAQQPSSGRATTPGIAKPHKPR